MHEKIGLVAGSFDPITEGHLWVIERGLKLVDRMTVAVANARKKTYTFPAEERKEIVEKSLKEKFPGDMERLNVIILPDRMLLINFAKQATPPVTHLFRGIRDSNDFVYEQKMCNMHKHMAPEIDTILLCTPKELSEVSSSIVKDIFGLEGSSEFLRQYVPAAALKALEGKLGGMA